MQKKKIIILTLLSALLVACADSDKKTTEKNQPDKNEKQEETTSNENIEATTEESSEENNEEEEREEPQYELNENWSVVPIEEDTNEKVVLLTIDDAPDEYALEMAKTLDELNVKAIFFVNGHFLNEPEKQEALKEIHDMGFMIGNHTYNHAFLPDLTEDEQEEEIVELNDLVEEIIGERPHFFRAPNGENTDKVKKIVEKENMTMMNWSYGYDFESDYQTKDAITDIMLNTELLGDGANLLMHDREWTAKALQDIVEGLEDKGYEMVDPHLLKTE